MNRRVRLLPVAFAAVAAVAGVPGIDAAGLLGTSA